MRSASALFYWKYMTTSRQSLFTYCNTCLMQKQPVISVYMTSSLMTLFCLHRTPLKVVNAIQFWSFKIRARPGVHHFAGEGVLFCLGIPAPARWAGVSPNTLVWSQIWGSYVAAWHSGYVSALQFDPVHRSSRLTNGVVGAGAVQRFCLLSLCQPQPD